MIVQGNALRLADGKSEKITLKRGIFTAPEDIPELNRKRDLYLKSNQSILSNSDLIAYYDFMELDDSNLKKMRALGVKIDSNNIAPGPYIGSTSVSFNTSGDNLQIPLPKEDFYIIIEYKFKTFKDDIFFMRSDKGGFTYTHDMAWYKNNYEDKTGIMKDGFFEWRNIGFSKLKGTFRVYALDTILSGA